MLSENNSSRSAKFRPGYVSFPRARINTDSLPLLASCTSSLDIRYKRGFSEVSSEDIPTVLSRDSARLELRIVGISGELRRILAIEDAFSHLASL